MPVVNDQLVTAEGKFTQEGGGVTNFKDRVENLQQLHEILDLCFGANQKIDLEQFSRINEEIASDSLLLVKKSSTPNNNANRKTLASPRMTQSQHYSPNTQTETRTTNPVPSSQDKYVEKPEQSKKKRKLFIPRVESLDGESKTSSIPNFQMDQSFEPPKDINELFIDNVKQSSFGSSDSRQPNNSSNNNNVMNIDFSYQIQSIAIQKQTLQRRLSQFKYCACGLPIDEFQDSCDSCQGLSTLQFEGAIFKKQKKGGIFKLYWYVLLGKELYTYKTKGDQKHKEMQSLVGVHVKDQEPEQVDEYTILFPFQEEKLRWMDFIKQVIGYSDFFQYYEVGDTLGSGKYGVVRKAYHKKQPKQVAVKFIKKKDLTLKDLELMKREIEVLKVCQHPNIIKLEDVFENQDFLFIVMEYVSGGDFFGYLQNRGFRLTEERARQICHQIATALYYLHSFGIAHRDLKPENILMHNSADDSEVKIVDFGLSKSFAPSEKSLEPYGTISYVAPEILLQQPYDKKVDLWSLGVILHAMLSGTLPFDDPNQVEVARKIVNQNVAFNNPIWNSISAEAKDLISSLQQVLEHQWIAKRNKKIANFRKKSSDEGDRIKQFIAYTNTDLEKARLNSPRLTKY
ncbi:UNKNOWN [Stylonychia lemnae]|uniref:Protein kinase domain-containing protein n=1 Tax=Stylonychia lemnae TaxID=5949 RepID=A0A077ZRE1_STYLE|nr:UNKNOWN [Stylonychia lemnae]|eukprot:CDW72462.1 UNKNOWN [Stylonychia lemnae]